MELFKMDLRAFAVTVWFFIGAIIFGYLKFDILAVILLMCGIVISSYSSYIIHRKRLALRSERYNNIRLGLSQKNHELPYIVRDVACIVAFLMMLAIIHLSFVFHMLEILLTIPLVSAIPVVAYICAVFYNEKR